MSRNNEDDDPESFICPDCGRRSFHPKDVEQRFCGACDRFFDELGERVLTAAEAFAHRREMIASAQVGFLTFAERLRALCPGEQVTLSDREFAEWGPGAVVSLAQALAAIEFPLVATYDAASKARVFERQSAAGAERDARP